jgi:hypothetical protein
MSDKSYYVEKSSCYPAQWKVRSSRDNDNSTHNYFRNREDALAEAERRNQRQPK